MSGFKNKPCLHTFVAGLLYWWYCFKYGFLRTKCYYIVFHSSGSSDQAIAIPLDERVEYLNHLIATFISCCRGVEAGAGGAHRRGDRADAAAVPWAAGA